jgi:hypothetical protein
MAESIHILGEGGAVFMMDLPLPEAIADRLARGHLRQVQEDGSPFEESQRPGVPGLPSQRPVINASKAEWVGWAVAQGMIPDDAEAATKTDLIEKFGATAQPEQPEAPEGVNGDLIEGNVEPDAPETDTTPDQE